MPSVLINIVKYIDLIVAIKLNRNNRMFLLAIMDDIIQFKNTLRCKVIYKTKQMFICVERYHLPLHLLIFSAPYL